MSTIRPLATITLLAAMGVFLYLKINDGSGPATMSEEESAFEGAPKFEAADSSSSPSTYASAPTVDGPPPAFASTTTELTEDSEPPTIAAPELPDLPPVAQAPSAEEPPSVSLDPPSVEVGAAPGPIPRETTTTETEAAEVAAAPAPVIESPAGLPPIPELPPLPSATEMAETTNPVAPAPPEVAQATATETTPEPGSSPFDAARPAINAALSQGELARAHLLLSDWYNDPALSAEENEEVKKLLNQLAGTVIYSNQHFLEPAYTVQTGETLETIAEKHQVPWQLLAKINGIASATGVSAGQEIKVVRGPFMGVVDVSDAELTLSIDGRYAGKFPVQLDGAATGEGEWTVEQKQLDPSVGTSTLDRKLVLRSAENPGDTVVIAPASSPTAGTTPPKGTIRIAPEQAEDLYDILSVGSRVVVRR